MAIREIAPGGDGVGRLASGKVCFVPFTLPGEEVEARVVKETGSYARAELVAVLSASADRVEPVCPVFGRCGGCQFQHASYPLQLEIKRRHVIEALSRIGGISAPDVAATVPSPLRFGYRNRIVVHAAPGALGFFESGSRRVVDVERCPLASDAVNEALRALRVQRPAGGSFPLRESSGYRGFRQVNAAACEVLVALVDEVAGPGGGVLVDAYCGAGLFALRLAPRFDRVIGIEWSADAVRAARAEAPSHVEFLEGDVVAELPRALARRPGLVIVDPPAEGLPEAVRAALRHAPPSRLVYVSCDPATMARDAARLAPAFQFRKAFPIDMFAQTAAIECVALFERRPGAVW